MTTMKPGAPLADPDSLGALRARFPALAREHAGHPVAYFDGPGGTQVPAEVAGAMTDYLFHHNANTHWRYPTSAETDAAIAAARGAFADFFNASAREIAFGNNMTTITFHVARAIGRELGPGDEIVVTELDHEANVAPWRALAKERGVAVKVLPFDVASGELDLGALAALVTARTRVVAIGAASNALGTISEVATAADIAHAHGALCYVDAVHYAAHGVIDVQAMGCDYLVASAYKFYGPHAGVLYGKADLMANLDVPKLAPASNAIPERMETGTQNHEGIVGAAAAVDFLASLGAGATRRARLVSAMQALHARGDALFARLWAGLNAIPGVACAGPPPGRPRTPTVSFSVAGLPSGRIAQALSRDGIFASHGDFYAPRVIEKLGHADAGMLRAGCACYTTETEIERLLDAVERVAAA